MKWATSRNTDRLLGGVELVSLEGLHLSKESKEFDSICTLDKRGDGGLWFASSKRLFVLLDYMRTYKVNHVLHLEGDIMLYTDAAALTTEFRKKFSGGMAATPLRHKPATYTASVMYVDNAAALSDLAELFLTAFRKDHEYVGSSFCEMFL